MGSSIFTIYFCIFVFLFDFILCSSTSMFYCPILSLSILFDFVFTFRFHILSHTPFPVSTTRYDICYLFPPLTFNSTSCISTSTLCLLIIPYSLLLTSISTFFISHFYILSPPSLSLQVTLCLSSLLFGSLTPPT